jgi:UDP-glucose 4-epimerase
MRVLVTGGSGAIGEYVVVELLKHGAEVTVLDMRPPRQSCAGADYAPCDLTDLAAAQKDIQGGDAVVHLAAIPNPQHDPADRVLGVNLVSTFNVLEAARLCGIGRIVYACSESATGFGIHNVWYKPLYVPIDEAHPCWPHECYSLSKFYGEEFVLQYARAYGLQGISLRYPWVWTARDDAGAREIVRRARAGEFGGGEGFGAYIAPHDVAQGVRLALDYRFPAGQKPAFEAFFLHAATTCLPVPTLQALAAQYDPLPPLRDADYFAAQPDIPVFDTRKARRLLGYVPSKDWRDYEHWEKPGL